MGDDRLTLGGRELTPGDFVALGALAAAVESCRSVELDSRAGGSVTLHGVANFAAVVLAVEHFRKRGGREG